MREDGHARTQVGPADGSQHLALVRVQLEGGADLAERAPPLARRVLNELLSNLFFASLNPGSLRIRRLVIASGDDDVNARARRDRSKVLDLLRRTAAGPCIDDAGHTVASARPQLVHDEIDVRWRWRHACLPLYRRADERKCNVLVKPGCSVPQGVG